MGDVTLDVLIVESNPFLGKLWSDHLLRLGMSTYHVTGQENAIEFLSEHSVSVIVLNLLLETGSALAVSDYASYRWPDARVVFVTNTTFFSDGSIFRHCSNACAFLPQGTEPDDLAAMVRYYSAG